MFYIPLLLLCTPILPFRTPRQTLRDVCVFLLLRGVMCVYLCVCAIHKHVSVLTWCDSRMCECAHAICKQVFVLTWCDAYLLVCVCAIRKLVFALT